MERTTFLKEGADMDVNDHLSITFLPNSHSHNTLRLNFKEIGDENFSLLMTPCEALDIISSLGVAVQFYLHNQTQYKDDVVKHLINNKKRKRNEVLNIDMDKLLRLNENKRINSYDDIYKAVSMLSDDNREIMLILTEVLDAIPRLEPEVFASESYYISFFDLLGFYGEDIRFIYTEVCESDPVNMLVFLIAICKGVLSYNSVKEDIGARSKLSIDFKSILSRIKEDVPLFSITDIE